MAGLGFWCVGSVEHDEDVGATEYDLPGEVFDLVFGVSVCGLSTDVGIVRFSVFISDDVACIVWAELFYWLVTADRIAAETSLRAAYEEGVVESSVFCAVLAGVDSEVAEFVD